jgi:hypothetical protein
VCAKRRREPAERDRRLEKLAIEVLTALGERNATIAATEQRAGAALQAMITDESLTVSEAVQRCAGAISHREAARLRQLAAQAQNNKPENDSARAADIDDVAHKYFRRTWSFGQLPPQDASARTPGRVRRLTGGRRRVPACQLPTGSSPCTSLSANLSTILRSYTSCLPRRRVTKQEMAAVSGVGIGSGPRV